MFCISPSHSAHSLGWCLASTRCPQTMHSYVCGGSSRCESVPDMHRDLRPSYLSLWGSSEHCLPSEGRRIINDIYQIAYCRESFELRLLDPSLVLYAPLNSQIKYTI